VSVTLPFAGARPRFRSARPVLLALPPLLSAAAAYAFPDGAPWEAAEQEGCAQCHFDAPPREDSSAVTIDGLPTELEAGRTYPLTVRLSDRDMAVTGFLLSAWQGTESAGRFTATDDRVETKEAQARSTEAGTAVTEPGQAEWSLSWTAPDRPARSVVLDLWINAGNGDRSPFEDTTHHRKWRIDAASDEPAGEARPR
jgi:hypothetical protein